MKLQLVLLINLMVLSSVFAQSGKLKRADKSYSKLAYSSAAKEYEGLVGSEVDSPKMKSKLAYCYYQIGSTPKAEQIYGQMVLSGDASHEDIYNYAQSLKENGKYAASDEWMGKFAELEPKDIRGEEYKAKKNYLEIIEKQGVHFSIKHLAVNTINSDFGGYPSKDQSSVYFLSTRSDRVMISNVWMWKDEAFLDVHLGKKAGNNEIETPELITRKVNTKYHEGPLCIAPDNKTVYFTRNNIAKGTYRNDEKGIQNLKLYIADLEPDGSWSNESEFSINNREYSVGHPSVSADGQFLYFSSDMQGGFGGADIYRVSIGMGGTFGKPENLGSAINTEGQEMFPWVNAEGYLFFSSDGRVGLGGLDVFVMIPNDKGGISKVLNVGKPVNSQKDDFAFTMLKNNTTGYFSSNREGGAGDDDIYSYVLTAPFKVDLVVSGIAYEKGSKTLLPGAEIVLKDEAGEVIEAVIADDEGNYSFTLEPDKNYTISTTKKDYFDSKLTFSTSNLEEGTEKIEKDIALDKDPGLSLYALIKDGKTNLPLSGVKIEIIENYNKSLFADQITSENGDVLKGLVGKKMNDQLSYTIQLSKQGYLSKSVQFNTTILQPGVINVHELLDITLDKIEVGIDLASLIDIKPIYFDYGKFVIRSDASTELDKIVKVMNEYPTMQIELGSHTDCRGAIAANEKLSNNRAMASATYVKARIANPDRIYGKGFGESKLKNGCACEGKVKSTCTDAEHQENRRTEFIIIKM